MRNATTGEQQSNFQDRRPNQDPSLNRHCPKTSNKQMLVSEALLPDRNDRLPTLLSSTKAEGYTEPAWSSPIVVLRLKQLVLQIGMCRASIYDKLNPNSSRHDPSFPKPIKLGSTAVGFLLSEVNAWIDSRISASRPNGKAGVSK